MSIGESLTIELFDRATHSQKALINTYTYTCEEYDDISFKLTLTNFEVKLK